MKQYIFILKTTRAVTGYTEIEDNATINNPDPDNIEDIEVDKPTLTTCIAKGREFKGCVIYTTNGQFIENTAEKDARAIAANKSILERNVRKAWKQIEEAKMFGLSTTALETTHQSELTLYNNAP